jgi:hypothetical protein
MGRRNHDIDQETLEVLGGLEDQEDLRNGYAAVRHRIEHYVAAGCPVPPELVTAERQLMTELMAQSQGR